MRKDVRFGLIIGGSLIAVLIIWASLLDRSPRKTSTVALIPAAPSADVTQSPASIVAQPPLDTTTSNPPPVAAAPPVTTQPDVADTSSAAGGRDWTRLLDSGAPPLMATDNAAATQPVLAALTSDTATTQPASAMASSGRTHKVQQGETFYTIAAAVYGSSKYVNRLENANRNVNPNKLRVGTVLNVPDLQGSVAAAAVAAADVSTPPLAVDASKSYRVQASDTLMGIARKLYGNGNEWQKIYDANRDAIGPNPARLRVDMVLRLPAAPTVTTAN